MEIKTRKHSFRKRHFAHQPVNGTEEEHSHVKRMIPEGRMVRHYDTRLREPVMFLLIRNRIATEIVHQMRIIIDFFLLLPGTFRDNRTHLIRDFSG